MTPSSLAFLHGAPGVEIGPLAYLLGVLVHLLAVGGIAALVYSASKVTEIRRAERAPGARVSTRAPDRRGSPHRRR